MTNNSERKDLVFPPFTAAVSVPYQISSCHLHLIVIRLIDLDIPSKLDHDHVHYWSNLLHLLQH